MDAGYTSCGASYGKNLRMALVKTIGGEKRGVVFLRLKTSYVFWTLHGVGVGQAGPDFTGLEEKF